MGLRTSKKEKTRNEILATAEGLFRTRGFAETSIRTIARTVPVSVQTLYNYFPSKEGILAAIATERFRSMAEAAERIRFEYLESDEAEGTPVERFLHLIRWGLRALADDRDFMRLVFLNACDVLFGPPSTKTSVGIAAELGDRQQDNQAAVTRMFEGMQKSGVLRDDVSAGEMCELYMLIYRERVTRWCRDPDGEVAALEDSVIGALAILMRGLQSNPAPPRRPKLEHCNDDVESCRHPDPAPGALVPRDCARADLARSHDRNRRGLGLGRQPGGAG